MNRQTQPESTSIEQQDGAVAIIAAVVIAFVAIILLAFSTDIGSLWQSQRALVTDTDAAALAGAIELAEDWMDTDVCSRDIAEAEAVRVLGLNNQGNGEFSSQPIPGSPTADCRVEVEGDAYIGQVQMTARQPSPGFVSRQDLSAAGTSTATFELLLGETSGFAVCENLFTDGLPRDARDDFVVGDYLLFPYKFAEKTLDEFGSGACKVTPANEGAPFTAGGWGWLDGPCVLEDGELATWCDAETGTDDLKKVLGGLEGETIDFPIFKEAKDPGSNATYLIVGRVKATLAGTCGSGKRSSEDGGFNPDENCVLPPTGKLQGQPGFVVVTDWSVTFFGDPTATKFRDARYSICDVDGTGDYCP